MCNIILVKKQDVLQKKNLKLNINNCAILDNIRFYYLILQLQNKLLKYY